MSRIVAAVALLACACPLHAQVRTTSAPPPPPRAAAVDETADAQFARISAGWKPTKRGEATLYCRSETRVGTRLAKPTCLTRQQLIDRARAGQEIRDRMARPNQCAGKCTEGG